jgi:hypothetical protein
MSDFITLTCPNCGGRLQITDDVERFACAFCGVEHVVRRSGGVVTLKPIVESLAKVQVGVDKTASELAITRLGSEIAYIKEQIEELTASHYRQMARLDLDDEAIESKHRPMDIAWASNTPLWKLGSVLLLSICCLSLFLFVLVITDWDNDSRTATGSIADRSTANSQSDAGVWIVCSILIAMLMGAVWLRRVWRYRRNEKERELEDRESRHKAMQQAFRHTLSTLTEVLQTKQRQLARHQDIVSRQD